MKKLVLIISLVIGICLNPATAGADVNCTIEIAASEFVVDGTAIQPGAVVCLLAGAKDYLLLQNLQGTAEQPITVINQGGPVVIDTDHFYGIKFYNCKHVIFSGNGLEGLDYGIQVKRVSAGAGMSIDYLSTNIEIEYCEISNTVIAGIYAKTEPFQTDCDNLITRDNFTMYDLKIHDCYLHDIADEGLYIGSSKFTGQTISQCGDIVVMPHVIEGVEVYNNLVVNTGWDGIQVSSAPENCKIYNNTIINDSYEEYPGQMSGIMIGGGSKCDCYNNKIYDGKGDGIDVFGMGFMKIYNNLIVRPGRTYKPDIDTEFKSGIYVGFVDGALSPNATFELYNNTIISPKSFGITYNNPNAAMGYASNNLITDPGYHPVTGNASFINLMVPNDKVSQQNNFNMVSTAQVKFIDPGQDNFDLKPNSAAVNYGVDLSAVGITTDIEGRSRPWHGSFDAGAYESHDPSADIEEIQDQKLQLGNAYPNPCSGRLNIPLKSKENKKVVVLIINHLGQTVFKDIYQLKKYQEELVTLDLTNFAQGEYYYGVVYENAYQYKPFTILPKSTR